MSTKVVQWLPFVNNMGQYQREKSILIRQMDWTDFPIDDSPKTVPTTQMTPTTLSSTLPSNTFEISTTMSSTTRTTKQTNPTTLDRSLDYKEIVFVFINVIVLLATIVVIALILYLVFRRRRRRKRSQGMLENDTKAVRATNNAPGYQPDNNALDQTPPATRSSLKPEISPRRSHHMKAHKPKASRRLEPLAAATPGSQVSRGNVSQAPTINSDMFKSLKDLKNEVLIFKAASYDG